MKLLLNVKINKAGSGFGSTRLSPLTVGFCGVSSNNGVAKGQCSQTELGRICELPTVLNRSCQKRLERVGFGWFGVIPVGLRLLLIRILLSGKCVAATGSSKKCIWFAYGELTFYSTAEVSYDVSFSQWENGFPAKLSVVLYGSKI